MTDVFDFSGALSRLGDVLVYDGKVTQVKLAEALGIRQSSISDAKRRNSIPADWFLKALETAGVDPNWIRTGTGPKYRVLSDEPSGALTYVEIEKRITCEQQRELTVSELMEALTDKLPEGASLSIQYGG
ncbi:bacteriophage CI repressor [Desulfovibrio sp. JC022]|nr:bacteriophage CI repressor [Desulfovibrio sp. JC022]